MSMCIVTLKARYHAVMRPVDFTLKVIPSPDDGVDVRFFVNFFSLYTSFLTIIVSLYC